MCVYVYILFYNIYLSIQIKEEEKARKNNKYLYACKEWLTV